MIFETALIQHALKCSQMILQSLADLEQETNLKLMNLHFWLKANKLSLNVAKTEFMVIGSRQKLLVESHNEINIKIEDQVISKVDHTKSLAVYQASYLPVYRGTTLELLNPTSL